MTREYNVNISIRFPNPLRVVLRVESDADAQRRLTEKLDTSADALQKAVEENTPPKP